MGKSTVKPAIKSDAERPKSKIGESFHVDFTGPNPTASIHGFLYSAQIVDEATGFIWKFCLTNKDDT